MPLSERALIARIRRATAKGRGVSRGIGDDCAVLRIPAGSEALITTDFSLEGVHFRREWHPPESVGHRCLARGLSDIAAMGGEPRAAFLSLALPGKLPQKWVDGFMDGLLRLANTSGVTLAGGDTAESPGGILADIVVVGSAPKGKCILRSTAKPGDRIFVSGDLGGAAYALRELMRKRIAKPNPADFPRHFFPTPRLALGRILREKKLASAMIDLSDGLSTDLAHICEESGVGAEIRADALPLAAVGKPARPVDLDLALHGGEDYELLFTVTCEKKVPSRLADVRISEIGRITTGKKIQMLDFHNRSRRLPAQGWEHLRS